MNMIAIDPRRFLLGMLGLMSGSLFALTLS